jgi:O-antigen/teichoic acid export membrane protein
MWRRVTSQSIVIFGARLTGAGIAFITQALIARNWGAGLLGDYVFVIAVVNVAATAMPLGFQIVGSYFAAEYRARQSRRALHAFMLRAYTHIGFVAAGLFAAGVCARWVFGNPGAVLAALWLPTLLMAVATAIVYVNGALLVGLKRPVTGLLADTLFRPMLAILGFAVAAIGSGATTPLRSMLWVMAIGYLGVAAVQGAVAVASTRDLPAGVHPAGSEPRRWWRYALPWILISLATDFFLDIDLVFLAHTMGSGELAVFGICARVCSLLAFGVAAVYTVTLPDILEAGARRNEIEFRRRLGDANLIAAALAVVFAAGMFATGPLLGFLFGPPFAVGGEPLGILSLGLVVRAILGPASLVLSFYDRPYASVPAAGLALVTLFVGNSLLTPAFGLNGAAVAALSAMTVRSGALWLTARRQVGVDVSIVPRLKEVLSSNRTPEPVSDR